MKPEETSSLASAIRQTQPFTSVGQEVYLSVLFTASLLSHCMDVFLKQYGITQAQYNVLRILRGAGPAGLGRNEIGERLVNAMPDVSRLLDRMESVGWISRARNRQDRRQVAASITTAGRKILKIIEKPINELHQAQIKGIAPANLKQLIKTMSELRKNNEICET